VSAFTGTGALVRLALRRDRIQLPIWMVALPVVTVGSAGSLSGVYVTEQDRVSYAMTTAASVATRALNGPVGGPTFGSIVAVELFHTLAVMAALMSTFLVVRHTRQNEETGRAELIGSAVVGRLAGLTAALVVAAGANVLVLGLIMAALLSAGLPATGSLALAAAVAGVGMAFAGVAAVSAQVMETARGANGVAAAAIGVAFLLRAVGDAFGEVDAAGTGVVSGWPTWLSPLGWGHQVRAFAGDRWWVLGLYAAFVAVAVGVAFALIRVRDHGTGLFEVRRGPAAAAPTLLSPLGLAWRLQRGVLVGWLVGVVVLAVGMGAVADEINTLIEENDQLRQMIEAMGGSTNLVDSYLAAILSMMGLAIAGYSVQAVLRMRAEEAGGPLETLLATSVSRQRFMFSHVACAGVGAVVLLVAAGFSMGLTYGLVIGEPGAQALTMTGAALAHVPATAAFAGLVVLAFAALPGQATALSWGLFAVLVLVGQLGAVLKLPRVVLDASPFTHTPQLPAEAATAPPLLILGAVAVVVLAAGFGLFRRRDISP
jgi:ABC-2 type transport system permease protein